VQFTHPKNRFTAALLRSLLRNYAKNRAALRALNYPSLDSGSRKYPCYGDYMFSLTRFKKWLDLGGVDVKDDTQWADEYTDPAIRAKITETYRLRYTPVTTPWTDPLLYDPLDPPQGWRYDPYNEFWVKL
jgi:hypothetical protein